MVRNCAPRTEKRRTDVVKSRWSITQDSEDPGIFQIRSAPSPDAEESSSNPSLLSPDAYTCRTFEGLVVPTPTQPLLFTVTAELGVPSGAVSVLTARFVSEDPLPMNEFAVIEDWFVRGPVIVAPVLATKPVAPALSSDAARSA